MFGVDMFKWVDEMFRESILVLFGLAFSGAVIFYLSWPFIV